MGWKAELRAMEAARRRQERDAKKRQRELERQAIEAAKLSAMEQARLEVETYDNGIEVLLSVHKEQADAVDWLAIATSLPPVAPRRHSHHELKARRHLAVASAYPAATTILEQAINQDELEYQDACKEFQAEKAGWQNMSELARRILAGDSDAYVAAIEQIGPFSELAGIGSSLHFRIHSPLLVEIELSTNGRNAIPTELKTLTSSGRVSVKPMPRTRFVEIYQDYVCSCVLRVTRELFALLPVEHLLLTATVEGVDTATGHAVERPFLSVGISRADLKTLNFDRLDPSDAIMSLLHRGDLKASRRTGDFESIVPLGVSDMPRNSSTAKADVGALVAAIARLRADLVAQCAALHPEATEDTTDKGDNT